VIVFLRALRVLRSEFIFNKQSGINRDSALCDHSNRGWRMQVGRIDGDGPWRMLSLHEKQATPGVELLDGVIDFILSSLFICF